MLFAALYFAEGGPIGFVWWALPVWMSTSGAEPAQIATVMALATWPWALKFLWAPLIDVLRTPRFGLRAWIFCSQLAMALSLVPLLFVDFGASGKLIPILLVMHAVAAATQDAAIDTLAVESVPEAERGAINGWMQTGMLLGRSIFGGGAVWLAGRIGEQAVLLCLMGAVILPATIALRLAREPELSKLPRSERVADYVAVVRELAKRRSMWIALCFAATVGAGFEGLATMAGPLLIDCGVSEDRVGLFFLIPTVVAMAIGALVGGKLSDRFGRRRLTAIAQAAAALCVIAVGICVMRPLVEVRTDVLIPLLTLLYFCAGAAVATLYGLLMDRTAPRVAALQFCIFMGGINLCMIWSTHLFGVMVKAHGYGPAAVLGGVLSCAALPALVWLGKARSHDASGAGSADRTRIDSSR